MAYYKIVEWKRRLMKNLDQGIFDEHEWLRFLEVATESGCLAMASDMLARMKHYEGVSE